MSKTAAPQTISELKSEARQKWNRWAVQLADTATLPQAREMLDAGIVLGFDSPADQLERDAKIITAVRARQAEIIAANARTAEWERETGGHEKLTRLVAELQAQLEKVEDMRLGNRHNVHARSTAEREINTLRRQHPELLQGL